jgi:tetratricopeptide (TPR) repeat protein
MKKKKYRTNPHNSGAFEPSDNHSDFYNGAPGERPLYQEKRDTGDARYVQKTSRHQAAAGHRKETADPRDKNALLGILRAAIILVILLIAFFAFWKAVKLYEDNLWLNNQSSTDNSSPVIHNVAQGDQFDITAENGQELIAEQIVAWQKTERLIRTIEDLLIRNNVALAINRCQQVLALNPSHIGALEHLGQLYLDQTMYGEAINTYIRLLGLNPARIDFQLALLNALDLYGDSDAVIQVAHWYQDTNVYNEEVQHFLARAYYTQEKYEEAVPAFERVLKDSPRNAGILEKLAVSLLRLEQYEKALEVLEQQVDITYRDQECYRRIAICQAQLMQGKQAVETLGKSAHLFGPDRVASWIQDPLMDPIRMDRSFQILADNILSEEYRRYLETVAKSIEQRKEEDIAPQLKMSDEQKVDAVLQQSRQ